MSLYLSRVGSDLSRRCNLFCHDIYLNTPWYIFLYIYYAKYVIFKVCRRWMTSFRFQVIYFLLPVICFLLMILICLFENGNSKAWNNYGSNTVRCCYDILQLHYCDVVMGAMPSLITSLTIVYSIVYSGTDQRKHQSSASLAFVREIHRWPVNSSHKWPVTRKMFPLDDVIMIDDIFPV